MVGPLVDSNTKIMPAYNRKLEALAEAVARYTGYHDPASAIHAARNPGALKAYLPEQPQDAGGHRVFASVLDGYQALLSDLQKKVTGRSRSRLSPQDSLIALADARSESPVIARQWSSFLRAALKDEKVTQNTQLTYFTE